MIMWISWSAYHLTRAADPLYFYRVVARPSRMKSPTRQSWNRPRVILGSTTLDKYLESGSSENGYATLISGWRRPLPFAEGAELPLSEFPNVRRWHDQLCDIEAWRDPFHGLG